MFEPCGIEWEPERESESSWLRRSGRWSTCGADRVGTGRLHWDDWGRLDRLLWLGVAGAVYGVGQHLTAAEVGAVVARCLAADGPRTVESAMAVAGAGGPRVIAVRVLALAAAQGDAATKALVFANLGHVCRTSEDLFQFVAEVQTLRGWGRGVRRAVASWYRGRYSEELAYQVLACRKRSGWSHRDVLRLAHPRPVTRDQDAVFRWILQGGVAAGERMVVRRVHSVEDSGAGEGGLDENAVRPERYRSRVYPAVGELPSLLRAFERVQGAADRQEIVRAIREEGLPREAVPGNWLDDPEVWSALADRMTLSELLRQLGRMTAVGLLTPGSEAVRRVESRLRDADAVRRDGVQPLDVLVAQRQYAAGSVPSGARAWEPVPCLVEAAGQAFHAAMANAPCVGRPLLVALDISRSMATSRVLGSTLSALEAAVAMAMVAVAADPGTVVVAFTSGWVGPLGRFRPGWGTGLTLLDITPGQRFEEVLERVSRLPGAGAEPSLPLTWARRHRLDVRGVVVYTDDQTWVKDLHPAEALRAYRAERVSDACLAVVGMTSSGFGLADPDDGGMLDVVGFDARVPDVVTRFLSGSVPRHPEPRRATLRAA